MPISSFGTVVKFTVGENAIPAAEVRSVDVSGESRSMVDTTKLNTTRATQMSGIFQNATITVTCLDRPAWTAGATGELTVNYGPEASTPDPTDYGTCVLTSGPNGSAAIDAAVEFSYTFEQVDAGAA